MTSLICTVCEERLPDVPLLVRYTISITRSSAPSGTTSTNRLRLKISFSFHLPPPHGGAETARRGAKRAQKAAQYRGIGVDALLSIPQAGAYAYPQLQ